MTTGSSWINLIWANEQVQVKQKKKLNMLRAKNVLIDVIILPGQFPVNKLRTYFVICGSH